MRKFFFFYLVLIFFSSVAQATYRLGFAGALGQTHYEAAGIRAHSELSYGGGILLEYSRSGFKGWEFAAISQYRSWQPESSAKFLLLPISYNYWVNSYLGFGIGGYYGYGMGNLNLSSVNRTYESAFVSRHDYGVCASLKINLPFEFKGVHLLLETRYNYGLKDVSTEYTSEKRLSDLQFLIGFRIGHLGYQPKNDKKDE